MDDFIASVDSISVDETLNLNNSVYQGNERTGVDFQQWTDFRKQMFEAQQYLRERQW